MTRKFSALTLDALLRKQMTSSVVEGKMWESKQPHIIDEVVIFFWGRAKPVLDLKHRRECLSGG